MVHTQDEIQPAMQRRLGCARMGQNAARVHTGMINMYESACACMQVWVGVEPRSHRKIKYQTPGAVQRARQVMRWTCWLINRLVGNIYRNRDAAT